MPLISFRYLRPLLLRDPHKHDEITDVYADIALALHHASVAKDRHSVHFHLRRLRPQLKKAFYYQQQNLLHNNQTGLLLRPFHDVPLHHIDLISDPTDAGHHQHHTHHQCSPRTSRDVSISESGSVAIENPELEIYYDIECDKSQQDENWRTRVSPDTIPCASVSGGKKMRWKFCCGCDIPLDSSVFDSVSMVSKKKRL